MKKLSLTLICLLFTAFAYAQYIISGKVLDKENKPIEFATVLLKKGQLVIKKSHTDDFGNYKLSGIQAGDYTLVSSHIHFSN